MERGFGTDSMRLTKVCPHCGEGDEEHAAPRGKAEVHNYGTAETIEASKVDPESSSFTGWKEFYKYTCKDCGARRYVEKHVHTYEVPLYLGDEEALAYLTANVTDELHPLRCTVEGCSSVIYEKHDYQPTVYATPTKNDDGTVSLGQYKLECHECEYVLYGMSLYEANNDTSWDTIRILVTAKNTAVQVLDSSDEFDTVCLATPGATVVLTPQQKDGQKVKSWKIKYTDYTQKDSAGKYKTVDLTRSIYKDDTDGTWWFVAPDQKYYESWGVNNGGWLYLTPVYTECKHENGTKLVNKKEAVCMYDGYTGDEACKDCGQLIGKIGDYIPAPSDEHEGEWELIEGTKTEANCKHGGYTGDHQCSDCGDIQQGKKVPVKHGERELRNVKAATCVSTGSTGDVYCKDCGEVLIAARQFPVLGHKWADEGTVTKAPATTETGEKTYSCTRTGCSKTRIVAIPMLASTAMESVAVTVKAPVLGETATKATNTDTTYAIAKTAWLDDDGYDAAIGSTFKGGMAYTVRVALEAAGDNVFADSTTCTVNGETAKVVSWYMDHAILTYTFPKTEKPSSSGGGSSVSTYAITVEDAKNGTVTADRKSASSSTTVTVTIDPDKGYTLETLTVLDKNGKEVKLADKGNGKYTFKMPASKVIVKPTFMEDNSMLNFFVDVPADAYYASAVLWAAANGITGGMTATTFSPDMDCTRA